MRFNDLARLVGGASKKMITERLRHLEDHGMVKREFVATSPVSVEYEISDFGSTAICILDELRRWSENVPLDLTSDGKADG